MRLHTDHSKWNMASARTNDVMVTWGMKAGQAILSHQVRARLACERRILIFASSRVILDIWCERCFASTRIDFTAVTLISSNMSVVLRGSAETEVHSSSGLV